MKRNTVIFGNKNHPVQAQTYPEITLDESVCMKNMRENLWLNRVIDWAHSNEEFAAQPAGTFSQRLLYCASSSLLPLFIYPCYLSLHFCWSSVLSSFITFYLTDTLGEQL